MIVFEILGCEYYKSEQGRREGSHFFFLKLFLLFSAVLETKQLLRKRK